MRTRLFLLSILAAVLIASSGAAAQVATGIYSAGTYDTKGFDTINTSNLNAHFTIPIFSKQGRAGLNFSHQLVYDSAIWTPVVSGSTKAWQPSATWGWLTDTMPLTGNFTYSTGSAKCFDAAPYTNVERQSNFKFTDAKGVQHTFGGGLDAIELCNSGLYPRTGQFAAGDGSGIVLLANGIDNYQIRYPNGTTVTPEYNGASSQTSISDSRGNLISTFTSGPSISMVDTTGTTVILLTGAGNASTPRVITYPTYTNGAVGTATVTISYAAYHVQTAFGCSGISEYSASSVSLVDHIVFADGQQYAFTYETTPGVSGSVTGRLAAIQMPGGGHIDYAYSGGSHGILCQDGGTATLTRSTPDDPHSAPWVYTRIPGSTSDTANSTTHTDVEDGFGAYSGYDFVFGTGLTVPEAFAVAAKHYNGAETGTPIIAEQTTYYGASQSSQVPIPIVSSTTTSTLDGVSTKQSTASYSSAGAIIGQQFYDYGNGSPGTLILGWSCPEYTDTDSQGSMTFTLGCLYGSSTETLNVLYTYDQYSLSSPTGNYPQFGQHGAFYGNITNVTYVFGSNDSAMTTVTNEYHYDTTGQVVSSTDAAGNTTNYTYDLHSDTFPTSITYPTVNGVTLTSSPSCDPSTGLLLSNTDPNGNVTSYTYDNMMRLLTASGGASTAQSNVYSLASTAPYTSSSVLHDGSSWIARTSYLDAYGRVSQTSSTDSPSNDLVNYVYDADGRLLKKSNPYRLGDPINYVQQKYDLLGRNAGVIDADGSQTSITYLGNAVTYLDEANKQRKIVMNGQGQPAQVWEPDANNNLTLETDYAYYQNQTAGTSTSPSTYQTIITQKGGSTSSSDWRVRTFTYDMMNRLLSSATPEAGTTTYIYPLIAGSSCSANYSAVCSRTDALGTTTSYSYDALYRPTGVSYSGTAIAAATPSVSYYYDQTSYNGLIIQNGKGQRTGMSDGSGETAWSFNAAGRATGISKTIDGITKQAGYSYNADGSINTIQDYAGTTLTYAYNAAGLPTGVTDAAGNSYAASATYNAAGQMSSINHQLTSTGASYVRSWQYNTMGQPSVISASLNGNTIQSLQYGYGTAGANNGNIATIVNGMNPSTRSQSYTYDNLNRLATANDISNWGESYTYDNWGNMLSKTVTQGSGYQFSVSAPNNRLSNQTYDAAGEVTVDQLGTVYSYNAEGRLLSVGSGSYAYDGDGNRVMKTVGSTTTLYWPGAYSLLDESNAAGTTMAKQISFAGLQVWSESLSTGGRFVFQDHLGSARITADAAGNLLDDLDYLPFGGVAANYGAAPSDNHYTFTGYESDQNESATDYAIFRNLGTAMGRFNRPDPYMGSYDFTNPQSLNRYAYTLNNPLKYVDPTGLTICFWGGAGDVYGVDDDPTDYGSTKSAQDCLSSGGQVEEDYQAVNVTFDDTGDLVETSYSDYLAPSQLNLDPSYQLSLALGKTGVYTLNSPCFVPGFLAASGSIAFSGVAAGGGYAGAESAEVITSTLKIPAVIWANLGLSTVGAWFHKEIANTVSSACAP